MNAEKTSPIYFSIEEKKVEQWLRLLQSVTPPLIPYNHDNSANLSNAFEQQKKVLETLQKEIITIVHPFHENTPARTTEEEQLS